MEEREVVEVMKAMGVSDEDIKKAGPVIKALAKSGDNYQKHRLVFEVVKARNCLMGVQVGQKIVVDDGMINKDASDCPLCMGLVAPLLPLNIVFYDRCMTGNLEEPLPEGVRCVDPGLDCPELNGLGTVLMSARVEPRT